MAVDIVVKFSDQPTLSKESPQSLLYSVLSSPCSWHYPLPLGLPTLLVTRVMSKFIHLDLSDWPTLTLHANGRGQVFCSFIVCTGSCNTPEPHPLLLKVAWILLPSCCNAKQIAHVGRVREGGLISNGSPLSEKANIRNGCRDSPYISPKEKVILYLE